MIRLHFKADFESCTAPFVVKLRLPSSVQSKVLGKSEALASPRPTQAGVYDCQSWKRNFVLHATPGESIDGDVLLCIPDRSVIQRLFRRASNSNTLLLTERCDQLCVMCSQPPKNTDDAWRFPLYEQALMLTDSNTVVGVSGGEPTLYKDALFGMIHRLSTYRPDLSYHILTNGQHFVVDDRPILNRLHGCTSIVWGIPLYSHQEETHDEIVGKKGAFRRVLDNLFLLASTNARIELRTVITALNLFDLPGLASFIAKNIPFIVDWALMGMEPIGYARANWKRLFFDHSVFPQPIINALEISALHDIPCHLYNIPRCTIPEGYRRYCVDSISDWKKKYLTVCDGCSERTLCCGFFEWYNVTTAWSQIEPIKKGDLTQ